MKLVNEKRASIAEKKASRPFASAPDFEFTRVPGAQDFKHGAPDFAGKLDIVTMHLLLAWGVCDGIVGLFWTR